MGWSEILCHPREIIRFDPGGPQIVGGIVGDLGEPGGKAVEECDRRWIILLLICHDSQRQLRQAAAYVVGVSGGVSLYGGPPLRGLRFPVDANQGC
jgi:hypothetical protein